LHGKALLAELSDEQLENLLPHQLQSLTPNTLTTRAALLREMAIAT
jgi:DNA-binding IclR family transcriptional regulator